jgi:DNA gyrase subunit A
MGRTAQGVKGIDLKGSDRVVGIVPIRREARILTVTDLGWGKQTELAEFPVQKRGGLGTLVSPASADAGTIVSALEVLGGDEVTLVTAAGAVHRVETDGVPVQGRRTRGSRLVSVSAGDRVVEVTRSLISEAAKGGAGGDEAATPEAEAAFEAPLEATLPPPEMAVEPSLSEPSPLPEEDEDPHGLLDSPGEQQDLFGA